MLFISQFSCGRHLEKIPTTPPILRLPYEVASYIFSLCVAPTPTIDEFMTLAYDFDASSNRVYLFQLTLSAVCQSWHRIVISDKTLWTSFTISTTPHSAVGVASLAQVWFNRSGGLPLVIRFIHKGPYPVHYDVQDSRTKLDQTGFSKPLLDAISAISDRWDMVAFKVPNLFMRKLRGDVRRPAAGLRCLALTDPYADSRTSAAFNIGPMPSPQRLWLNLPIEQVQIQWDNLTHLYVYYVIDCEDLLKILRLAPSLTYLCPTGLEFDPVNQSVAHHSSVRKLDIRECYGNLLDLFSFPALEVLAAEGTHLEFDVGINFIRRSQCSLRSLSLDELETLPTEGLVAFLALVPSLETLQLDYWEPGQTFFDHFASSSDFLPNLSTFHFFTDLREFPGTIIRTLVTPTTSGRRPLTKIALRLVIDFVGETEPSRCEIATFQEDDIRMIVDIRKSGIDITVVDENGQDIFKQWLDYYRSLGKYPQA